MKKENMVLLVAALAALVWVAVFTLWLTFCGAP
jgi:hypothetical protein